MRVPLEVQKSVRSENEFMAGGFENGLLHRVRAVVVNLGFAMQTIPGESLNNVFSSMNLENIPLPANKMAGPAPPRSVPTKIAAICSSSNTIPSSLSVSV